MIMKKNYYDILEISPQATTEQIKAAVVQLGKKYAAKAQNNQGARSKFNEIQQAYKVLSHPQRRKYHDEALAEQDKITILAEQTSQLTVNLSEQLIGHVSKFKHFVNTIIIKHIIPWSKYRYTQVVSWWKSSKSSKKVNNLNESHLSTEKQQDHNEVKQDEALDLQQSPEPKKIQDKREQDCLSPKKAAAKRKSYNLFDDEVILFYSKPHILSCIDIGAVVLIALSVYLYTTVPHFLSDYMPMIPLWTPYTINGFPSEVSLWILALVVIGAMGIAIQIEVIVDKFSTELLLTQHRLITQKGFLNWRKTNIKLTTMESISIQQTLLGRIFNYGTVTLTGVGHGKIMLRNLYAPQKMNYLVWFYIKKQ